MLFLALDLDLLATREQEEGGRIHARRAVISNTDKQPQNPKPQNPIGIAIAIAIGIAKNEKIKVNMKQTKHKKPNQVKSSVKFLLFTKIKK